ncbi:cytochrome c oxidase accessory protein CcoG [Vibrio rumoiensis]|uniref:Cytochrome c oxidase accessory protein CcoG n=1 Tax=Vibrio rumoiensis 1S-45 TaxID=1188252 RepID=A0A1E5E3L7_9VIBR|nr:cytochrome c oxidase accessory protein CcoG [Vibrio rumoiensis]OEF26051.1 cytochrome c oxidase accessory protein CcoG [Vibrio rumoiensis 1S-45]
MDPNRIDVKIIDPKTNRDANGKIYVRKSQGAYQKLRRYGGWFLMVLFAMIPWLSYDGRQAILFDLGKQQFLFFGATFFPQDLTLLALIFVIAAFGLFFLTTFLGRVWCGYLCPQTVWTFIFIWFEEKLEGPANKRRKQDNNKYSSNLILRKAIKHLAWWSVSIITGLVFVGYFIPIKELFVEFFTFKLAFLPAFWVWFFAACTYGNAGWMRAIMCLHMCPYARFQSAMFDKDTYIVGYDTKRGEKRGPRSLKAEKPKDLGDCIDCDLCVQVCPTGIDIRNGLQYECINCGACIDACDKTMERMGYEKGLISYTTEHKLSGKKTKITRPKLIGYGVALLLMIGLLVTQVITVDPVNMSVLRDRSQMYRIDNNGWIENTYTLKILNKTQQTQQYTIDVKGLKDVKWYGSQTITVPAGQLVSEPLSLAVSPDELASPIVKFEFILSDSDGFTLNVESRFIKKL